MFYLAFLRWKICGGGGDGTGHMLVWVWPKKVSLGNARNSSFKLELTVALYVQHPEGGRGASPCVGSDGGRMLNAMCHVYNHGSGAAANFRQLTEHLRYLCDEPRQIFAS
jgi:hypothetical protein